MENMFNLTPVQALVVLAMQAWMFIVFPVIVIKKINRLTDLVESQVYEEEPEEE